MGRERRWFRRDLVNEEARFVAPAGRTAGIEPLIRRTRARRSSW